MTESQIAMPLRVTTHTIPLSQDDLHAGSERRSKIQSASLPALNNDVNSRPRAKSERPASAIPHGRRATATSVVGSMQDMPTAPPRRAASAALRPHAGSRRRLFAPITSPHNGGSSRANSASFLARIKRTVMSIVDVRGLQSAPNLDDEEVPLTMPAPPTSSSLRVFVGTWNMCGTLPSELSPFLPAIPEKRDCFADLPHTVPLPLDYRQERDRRMAALPVIQLPGVPEGVEHPFHLMVIATQECQKSISESVMFPSKAAWEQQLADAFGAEYDMVACATMAALHLCVLVWRPCAKLVSRVESSSVPTGIGGVVGNKGGVGVALDFGPASLLFVNVHLTAHQENVALRNADYLKIETSLDLPLHLDQATSGSNVAAAMMTSPAGSVTSIPRARTLASDAVDFAIFTGDTNYRIEASSCAHVTKLLEDEKLDACLQADQLALHRKAGNTFIGFHEAPIRFLPTFKLSTTAPSIASGSIVSSAGSEPLSPSPTKRRGSFWTAKVASLSRRPSVSPSSPTTPTPSKSAVAAVSGSASGVILETQEEVGDGGSTQEIQQQLGDKLNSPALTFPSSRSDESLPVPLSGAANDITDLLSICSNEVSVTTSAVSISMPTSSPESAASPDTATALPIMSSRPRPAAGKPKRTASTKLLPKLRTSVAKNTVAIESDSLIARKYNPQRIPAWTDRILFKAKQDRVRAMEAATSVTTAVGTASEAMNRMDPGAVHAQVGEAAVGQTNSPAAAVAGNMDVFTESGTRLPSNSQLFISSARSNINYPPGTTLSRAAPAASVIAVPVYTAVHDQTGSDHAPVVGVFDLPFDWAALMAEMAMSSSEALANQDISALMDLDLTRTSSGNAPAGGGGAAIKAKLKKTRWILSWRGSEKSLGKVSPTLDKQADADMRVPVSSPLAAPPMTSARSSTLTATDEPVDVDCLLNLNPSLPRQPDGASSPPPEPSASADAAPASSDTQDESGTSAPPQLTSFRDATAIISAPTISPPTSSANVASPMPPLTTLSRLPRRRASSTGLPHQPHKLTARGRAHGKTGRKASIALLPGGVPHSPSTPKLPTTMARKVDTSASSQALSLSITSMASTSLSAQTGMSPSPPRFVSNAAGTSHGAGEGGESVVSQQTADVFSVSEIEQAKTDGEDKDRGGWLRRKKSKRRHQEQALVSPTSSANELPAGKREEGRRHAKRAGDPCLIM